MSESGFAAAFERSWLARRWRRAREVIEGTASATRVARAARRIDRQLADLLATSWLVSWLTTEPEPEVIVIDLRDTWTVGPVLAAIDALAARVPQGAGNAIARPVRRVADAPVRLLGVVLLAAGGWLVAAGLVAAGLVVLVAGALSLFETRSWDDLRETVTGRVLRAVFAPPDETTRR